MNRIESLSIMMPSTNLRKLPPGPREMPLLGNLWAFRKDPTGFLTRLARDYGDIASFRLGRQLAVQLNHPDLIRDVLVTHNSNFTKTRGLNRAKQVIGEGLLSSNGELHRRQRKLVQPAFQRRRIEAYGDIMTGYATQCADRWEQESTVDMSSEMLRLTLAIVGRTLFGADIESGAAEIRQAMTIVFEHFNRTMLPFSRVLANLPSPARRRYRAARQLLDDTVFRLIAQRRTEGVDRGDLMSILLAIQQDTTDSDLAIPAMPDRQVRDEIMTMFLAGHETTATMLTWTWYLLATNPEVEATLHAELDAVLAGNAPTVDDLPRLEYTRMVLSESMRLFPPVWTLTRLALDDYEVGSYVIPAGTVVGMSQFVMHRDPRFFPEPERFDPLRWTPDEVGKRPKFSYFPFGGGPRLCIGEPFAWMEATLLVATLCQQWQARVPTGFVPQLQPLITLRPSRGLHMTLHRRRPAGSTANPCVMANAIDDTERAPDAEAC